MALALLAVSAAPASATSSKVSTTAASCYVDAKTPTAVKSTSIVGGSSSVIATGHYRLTCTRNSSSVSSVNASVTMGVVQANSNGTYSTELADYSKSITMSFSSSTSYLDLSTTSFMCANLVSGNESLKTRVKVSLSSGTWSTLDYSTALSIAC